jgi:molybdopterin/thiamine biosynthesis adenylyltransferase
MTDTMNQQPQELTDSDRRTYEWQMWTPNLGEQGQCRLKNASVLVSRVGGVGGQAALQLAAAGVGRIVIAHAGDLRESDLNRQILMQHSGLNTPRVQQAADRLRSLNPNLTVVPIAENVSKANAESLVKQVDVVVDAAPLFEERFAMNAAAFALGRPIVEAAMFDLSLQVTTMMPGKSPCLRCLYPEVPPHWRRQFPVIGATAATAGALAALEVIKLITGVGEPLFGRLLLMDLHDMSSRTLPIERRPNCRVCSP